MGKPDKKNRYLVWGGLLGPVLFTVMNFLCGSLRPHYDLINQYISELGESHGAYSALMNWAGFIPSGLLFVAFAVGQIYFFGVTLFTLIGALLVIVFGGGMTALGYYSCDTGCSPIHTSHKAELHSLIATVGFISGIASMIVWGYVLNKTECWKKFGHYSFINGVLAYVFLYMVHYSILHQQIRVGLWERLCLGLIFLWCMLFSKKLLLQRLRN